MRDSDDYGAPNLPPEAFVQHVEPVEINDSWIRSAERDEQREAMRAWWYTRYEDPAQGTPYNGREGGYLYVHGGPFDPAQELQERFGSDVNSDVIGELVNELHGEVGEHWASVRDIDDRYDEQFDVEPHERHEPLSHLLWGFEADSDRLMMLATDNLGAHDVLLRHAIISVVAAMETYLWETAKYWASAEPEVLRNLVTKSPKFKDKPLKLGDIFDRHARLIDEVNEHFRSIVWHRLDEVKPLLECAFDVALPSVKALLKSMVLRHDLVHRNGRSVSGDRILLNREHFAWLKRQVIELCIAVEAAVVQRWPDDTAKVGLQSLRDHLAKMGNAGTTDPWDLPPPDF